MIALPFHKNIKIIGTQEAPFFHGLYSQLIYLKPIQPYIPKKTKRTHIYKYEQTLACKKAVYIVGYEIFVSDWSEEWW